jgi:hypothetical protein
MTMKYATVVRQFKDRTFGLEWECPGDDYVVTLHHPIEAKYAQEKSWHECAKGAFVLKWPTVPEEEGDATT